MHQWSSLLTYVPLSARVPAGPDLDHYAAMTLFDVQQNEKLQQKEQLRRAEQKVQIKKQLDEQVEFRNREAARNKKEEEQWVKQERERLEHWNRQEKEKQVTHSSAACSHSLLT